LEKYTSQGDRKIAVTGRQTDRAGEKGGERASNCEDSEQGSQGRETWYAKSVLVVEQEGGGLRPQTETNKIVGAHGESQETQPQTEEDATVERHIEPERFVEERKKRKVEYQAKGEKRGNHRLNDDATA